MRRILCIGDLCADLIIPYGEAKRNLALIRQGIIGSSQVELRSGGTAGNTAAVLGKLGERPVFVTDLCRDRLGTFLKGEMERYGVDMSMSPAGERGAMVCIAVVEENGDRTMFSWIPPGAGYPTFSADSFRPELFLTDSLIFTGGMSLNNDSCSMKAVRDFVAEMKEKTDSLFVFDLNTRIETYGLSEERRKYYGEMIRLADVVLGSGIEEFGPLTGKDTLGEAAASMASENRCVIARDGKNPVMIVEKGRTDFVETEQVFVVSTVGAGDTFNGAFLSAYNRGYSLKDCVKFANETAGYMISHPGHLEIPEDGAARLKKF